jgi:hypothetical protein
VENRPVRRLRLLLACIICSGGIGSVGTVPVAAADNIAATQPAATVSNPAKTYDLRFRPTVGLRWAHQALVDSDIHVRGTATATAPADSDEGSESAQRARFSIVVNNNEVTEVRDGVAVGQRVTFGSDCWSAIKENDKKAKKQPLFFAGTTMDIRLTRDGTVTVNALGRPGPEDLQRLRNAMKWQGAMFPNRPVAIGEQWRSDEALRAMTNLAPEDDVSTAFALQGVRAQDGRDVANVALAARVITRYQGMRVAINYRGTVVVDMATGVTLKADLNGQLQVAGNTRDDKAKKLKVSGGGKLSYHSIARLIAAPGVNGGVAAGDGSSGEDATAGTDLSD